MRRINHLRLPQCGFLWHNLNTLRPGKIAAISQTTVSNRFSWTKMHEFPLKFHWSLFLRFQLIIIQHWSRYNGFAPTRWKPLFETMMARLSTHVCINQPDWVECAYSWVKWSHLNSNVKWNVVLKLGWIKFDRDQILTWKANMKKWSSESLAWYCAYQKRWVSYEPPLLDMHFSIASKVITNIHLI